MELREFSHRRVRITDTDGRVFEGFCRYLDAEAGEVIYGRSEEALVIANFLFFVSSIRSAETIEAYSGPYGLIEEMNGEDDPGMVQDVLETEDDDSVGRMLVWLRDHPDALDEQLRGILKQLAADAQSPEIARSARALIEIMDV